jgi:hypothetical protein
VNEADKCVYYRFGGGQRGMMCLYVDDILIFSTNFNVIEEIKSFLSQSFEMKDMGEAGRYGRVCCSKKEMVGLHCCNCLKRYDGTAHVV